MQENDTRSADERLHALEAEVVRLRAGRSRVVMACGALLALIVAPLALAGPGDRDGAGVVRRPTASGW